MSRLFQPSTPNVTACQSITRAAHRHGAFRFGQLPYATLMRGIIDCFRIYVRLMPYNTSTGLRTPRPPLLSTWV